ncbi:HAD family phosphatase [Nonomuraea sp. NN258]|nr:HAD family phosphatase [Nonomuraea antri]
MRAVVFDIGGVLELSPISRHEPSAGMRGLDERWEAKLGLTPGRINEHMDATWRAGTIGAVTLDEVHRELARLLGDESEAYMEEVWAEYLGVLNTELADYLAGLRPRCTTGILSNSFVGAREREQAAYGFEDLVDHLVYSHEAGMTKPDPAIYLLTCERLGVRPEETVFLDDVEPYVAGARAAGLHAVLYRDNAQAITALNTLLNS